MFRILEFAKVREIGRNRVFWLKILTKSAYKNMLGSLYRDPKIVILAILTLFIKLFSLRSDWVERYYTYGFYPVAANTQRLLFGWIPFSIGDLLYLA
ncbi:MAG TPA: hypothetical protein VNS32_11240, partial [Flavisolibacter sp.]|nr:hypothetical protein [Flavisolibacter sp.]